MKALVLEAYNKLVYKEVDDPTYKSDEVLVRVKAVGICGSDVHGMDGSTGRRQPPIIMGHEAAGEIVAVGKNVKSWQIGDRVTFDSTIYQMDDWYSRRGEYNLSDNRMVLGVSCDDYHRNGAFAEFLNVPAHILYKIPGKVSFEQAALVEPFAVAAHAISLSHFQLNDTVVIIGAGLIGLSVIHLLKINGAGNIIVVDKDKYRLEQAAEIGADHTFTPTDELQHVVQQLTQGRGADLAFEAVGVSETITAAIHSVRKGATVTLVGNISPMVNIPLQAVVTRQIKLQGSCAIAGEYPLILSLMSAGRINPNKLISKVAPLSEGAQWFDKLYRQEPGLLKVILTP